MTERLQTLVGCDRCQRGFPYRDLVDIGEGVLLCPDCLRDQGRLWPVEGNDE